MKIIGTIALLLPLAVVCARPALAQGMSSTNYRIPVAVVNSGGGMMSSANYALVASIGEPIIGTTSVLTGDVNRDTFVNAADVQTVLRIAGGTKNSSDADVNFSAADADANLKIELFDAGKLWKQIQSGTGSGYRMEAGFLAAAFP